MADQEKPAPALPLALIEWLEGKFRSACPDLSWNDRKVWFEAGRVDIVKQLRAEYEMQQEERGGA